MKSTVVWHLCQLSRTGHPIEDTIRIKILQKSPWKSSGAGRQLININNDEFVITDTDVQHLPLKRCGRSRAGVYGVEWWRHRGRWRRGHPPRVGPHAIVERWMHLTKYPFGARLALTVSGASLLIQVSHKARAVRLWSTIRSVISAAFHVTPLPFKTLSRNGSVGPELTFDTGENQ